MTQTHLGLDSIVLFVSDMAASRSFYEHTLGLIVLAANPQVVMFSAGHIQLCLLAAAEHEVTLGEGPDRSADITFMVENLPRCRDALATRGVRFSRTLEYSIGQTVDFYDPDGQWFSLYQPSEAAIGWPSGAKLVALASGLPMRGSKWVPPVDAAATGDDLADAFIAYVFLFFSDPEVAAEFYGGVLELDAIEGGPCRRVATSAPVGVVKYDVGTTLLTTHHVESDDKRFKVATVGSGGVALAFSVADLTTAVTNLSHRGIAVSDWQTTSPIGRLARFTDPAGHVLLLRHPTQEGEWSVLAGMSANSAAENSLPTA
jgi:catechol 2,3-dioxygenase-like lactoylglutathione lyase family enzyme